MAEVQTSTESGEMAQRFIELVMMQAQNAAYALGQIPHPETGEAPVNLDLARLFIDQLVVLRAKTRGNLNTDETGVLNNAISNLQMAFLEIAQGPSGSPGNGNQGASAAAPTQETTAPEAEVETPPGPVTAAPSGEESRKKFTKSYGA
jgi:hypothetical protein